MLLLLGNLPVSIKGEYWFRVSSYELRVSSLELRITSFEFRVRDLKTVIKLFVIGYQLWMRAWFLFPY